MLYWDKLIVDLFSAPFYFAADTCHTDDEAANQGIEWGI